MRKNTTKRSPTESEIKSAAKQIESLEFLKCNHFADTLIRYVEIVMKRDVVSRLQGQALRHMIISENSLTPTKLSRLMYRSKHSMTKIIDNLEKQGLVVRDHTGKDRRVTYIKITSDGLNYVLETYSRGELLGPKILSCLTPDEQKQFLNMTERMRNRIVEIMNEIEIANGV
jgi:DNA-binding MarR family transcriptional regulator